MSHIDRLSPDDWTEIERCVALALTLARRSRGEDDPLVIRTRGV